MGEYFKRFGRDKSYLVRLDMGSESDIELLDCAQHCLTVASNEPHVQDGGGLGDIPNVLANVELLEFFLRGRHIGN